MRKTLATLGSAALALVMFGTSLSVANAAPLNAPVAVTGASDVTKVDDRMIFRHRGYHRGWTGERGGRYNPGPFRNPGMFSRDAPVYYNGHRGYREWRHGYRRYNGFWFPGAAFATGVILGDAISEPRYVRRGMSRSHVEYCMQRYRSYRVSDDTYQPSYGPRRRCTY